MQIMLGIVTIIASVAFMLGTFKLTKNGSTIFKLAPPFGTFVGLLTAYLALCMFGVPVWPSAGVVGWTMIVVHGFLGVWALTALGSVASDFMHDAFGLVMFIFGLIILGFGMPILSAVYLLAT